ncbi:pentapeptide repeat-containing protein [Paracoccus marinaquae]|uniref:Pentapeptide repeat-containing protein n=1 Tax=Paracoccus marinaquae TaxID=2841926 RepID=A0ABS6ANW8_9RHOB|nr:pentapeptide repeat-containing protein [Paracoccus marinaquae]MBU3031812.1 pentapeptide repeat-containing protein [Paracoccus marinaquae]
MSEGNRINLRHILHRRRQAAGDAPPAPATDAPTAGQVNALITTCKTNWFLLMSYLAFVGVTLIGVVDLDFFMPERRTELPLIGVTIPTALFFYIAPVLGVMLYAHLHFYLMRLWRALAHPDAPDAGALNPWLVVDYALHIRGRGHRRFPLQWLANLVVTALIFWATPIILTGFWWRSMPKHDGWLTLLFCGGSLFLSVLVWAESGWVLHHGVSRRADRRRSWLTDLIIGAAFVLIPITGFVRAVNMWPLQDRTTLWPDLLAKAQLQNAVFVETPAGWLPRDEAEQVYRRAWCEQNGVSTLACGPGPLSDAEPADFLEHQQQLWCDKELPAAPQNKGARCVAAFENMAGRYAVEWQKTRRDALALLPRRNLAGVDLRGAVLRGARMERADLSLARMERADLSWARMEGAVLFDARMEGADLRGARMEGADLRGARMERADLRGARMEGADLRGARMEGADLWQARMERADLRGARMEGADLWQARMERADLRGARMEGADLWQARMSSQTDLTAVRFSGAAVRSVDYSSVGISQDQVNEIFGDASGECPIFCV